MLFPDTSNLFFYPYALRLRSLSHSLGFRSMLGRVNQWLCCHPRDKGVSWTRKQTRTDKPRKNRPRTWKTKETETVCCDRVQGPGGPRFLLVSANLRQCHKVRPKGSGMVLPRFCVRSNVENYFVDLLSNKKIRQRQVTKQGLRTWFRKNCIAKVT